MTAAFLSYVVAFGAALGVVITIILAVAGHATARWFAALVGVFTLALVEEAADLARLPGPLVGLTVTMELLVGPMLLCAVRSLVGRPWRRRDAWHFVPFAASIAALAPFYAASPAERIAMIEHQGPAMTALMAFKGTWLLLYLGAAIWIVRGRADAVRPALVWARRVLLGMVAFGLVTMGLHFASRSGWVTAVDSDQATGLTVALGLFTVAVAFLRFRPVPAGPGLAPGPAPRRAYQTSPLDAAAAQRILTRLVSYCDEAHPHRDPELTLEGLAGAISSPPHHVSQVLNEQLGVGFYGFVNRRRVDDLTRRLADPSQSGATVLALGHECGFNSKASLNRVFKQVTGVTPTAFQRSALAGRLVVSPSRDASQSPERVDRPPGPR